jgi:hypothetical protein
MSTNFRFLPKMFDAAKIKRDKKRKYSENGNAAFLYSSVKQYAQMK